MWETWLRTLSWKDPLEKEIATHSSILAWRISWMEEPGRLQSMRSQRVGHNWTTSLYTLRVNRVSQVVLVVKNPPGNAGDIEDESSIPGSGNPLEEDMATHSSVLAWRIPWKRSLVGCSQRGCKESDTTGWVKHTHTDTHTHTGFSPIHQVVSAGDQKGNKRDTIHDLLPLRQRQWLKWTVSGGNAQC